MIGIYKITNPNGKVYVGQSIDIERRWSKYKLFNCSNQTKLLNSLKKYGIEFHIFEIIEECDISSLNELERYWQEYYNAITNGLNCRLTETHDKSGKLSNETKSKISKSNTGKIMSDASRKKMSIAKQNMTDETKHKISQSQIGKNAGKDNPMYGKKHTFETIEKIKEKRKQQIITEETKKKLSEAGKLRIWSDVTKQKISKANKGKSKPESMKILFGRPVLQYDLNHNFIKEYYSFQQAATEIGVSKLAIYNAASGRSKSSAGFIWKYKD